MASVERFHDQHVDINDPKMQENFRIMGLAPKQPKPKEIETSMEDKWLMANALKIERIRQRVQNDALKQVKNKGQSIGEMALQFMGINKIAYDLM